MISHGTISHCGALPYLYGKAGLACTTYATIPINNLGQQAFYDLYKSKRDQFDFNTFTIKEIDYAFDKMVQLRYSQPYSLLGKALGITITAYPAGHTLGGSIWKIKKGTDTIVYAVDYNHKKERHLNGTILHVSGDLLSRPSLLITNSIHCCNNATEIPRKQRDIFLMSTISNTLKNQGNVLIPMDSTFRVLEMLYLLEQHVAFSKLEFHFLFLTFQASRTISLAKNMLEWMGEAATLSFSQSKENPFDFKHFKMIHSLNDLKNFVGPKVVVTSLESMDTGFAFKLFREWGVDEKNTIVLADRGPSDSLADRLYQEWLEKEKESDLAVVQLNLQWDWTVKEKVALEGQELEAHLVLLEQQKSAQQEEELKRRAALVESDDDEMSDVEQGLEATESLVTQYDVFVKDMPRSVGFFKHAQAFRMFPVHQTRNRVDDYGETIDPSAYMRQEEQTAIEAAASGKPIQDNVIFYYLLKNIDGARRRRGIQRA